MLSPFDWNAALHPSVHWRTANKTVADEAKAYLDSHNVQGIDTNALVEALYPMAKARGEGITARKRIYDGLRAWWKHDKFADEYQTPGTGRRFMGRTIYPPLWHARRVVPLEAGYIRCPHCGETFKPTETTNE